MGRPKTPSAVKRLRGNPGRRPEAKQEPKPQKKKVKKPKNLRKFSPNINRLWNEIGPEMERLGLLTELDRMAFLMMLHSYDLATDARLEMKLLPDRYQLVRTDENGVGRKHPMLQIWRDQSQQFLTWAREFGLTPASRAKIGVNLTEVDDSLTEMLNALTGRR